MSTVASPRIDTFNANRLVASSLESPLRSARTFWPPKYNRQRGHIPEVLHSCVKNLFSAIDTDMDGYISYNELLTFVNKVNLSSFTPQMVPEVFQEIIKHRGTIFNNQLESPLSFSEVYSCCNFILIIS